MGSETAVPAVPVEKDKAQQATEPETKPEPEGENQDMTPEDLSVPEPEAGDGDEAGGGDKLPSPAESFSADVMRAGLTPAKGGDEEEKPEEDDEGKETPKAKTKPAAKQPEDPGPEAGAEEEVEDPAPQPANVWDKDRQRRDQVAANERKEMRESIARLEGALEKALTAPKPASSSAPRKDAGPDVDELLGQAEKINGDSSAEEIGNVLKGLVRAVKDRGPGAETPAELKDLRDTVKRLSERVEEQDKQAAQKQIRQATDQTIASLEKKHGDHLRNAARERAVAIFAEMGYDAGENRPDLPTWQAVMRAAYAEVAAEKGGKQKAPPAKSKAPQPNMAGGKAVPAVRPIRQGSLTDVMSQMRSRLGT